MKKASGLKSAPVNRQAVVDRALDAAVPDTADFHALHHALGCHHAGLAPDERGHIDDFEAAFADASVARTFQDAAPRWPDVARKFPAALEEAASLVDRGLLKGVTLSPRLRALCGRGAKPVEASNDVVDVVRVAVHEATPTVTLKPFRPDLDRAACEQTLGGAFVVAIRTPAFIMPVTAKSWHQALGILGFAVCQYADIPMPEPFTSYIAKLHQALASKVDEDGYGGSVEDKQRADELVRDYPVILNEMQAHIERLKAVEDSEEGRAVRDAFARKTLAWMKTNGVDVPTVSEVPGRSARTRTPPSTPSSAPSASRIRLPSGLMVRVKGKELKLVVDPEIAALVPPPTDEELAMLESNLLRDGCLDPVRLWVDGRRHVVVDGHNRLALCLKHGLPYSIRELRFADRTEAIAWVLAHQLGRRNLTPEARAYLRGRLYAAGKAQGARRDLTSGQSDQKSTTAAQLAEQYKVGEKTIRRDAHFAEQVDRLVEVGGVDLKNEVLNRGGRITRKDVAQIVALDAEAQRQVVDAVNRGEPAAKALRAHTGAKIATQPEPIEGPSSAATAPATQVTSELRWVDALLRDLARGVAHLKGAAPGSLEERVLAAIDEQVQALAAELVRHRRALRKEG